MQGPGPFARRLAELATYKRKGRVPSGEEREVRFYRQSPSTIWIPRGLVSDLRKMVPDIEVVDRTLAFKRLSFGWRGRLRPEQAWAVKRVASRGGGIVVAPPGVGKTIVGLGCASFFGQPTLWLVHTKDLARDARGRAQRFFDLPSGAIGYIAERQVSIGTHITVATVQSLTNRPDIVKTLAKRIGLVITDESHHDSSLTRSRLVSQFPARFRCGLTATPDRTDGLEGLFHDLFGGVAANIPLEYGFEHKRLMRPSVVVVETRFDTYDGIAWDVLQKARASSGHRNSVICRLAAHHFRAGRHVMVLTDLIDHANYLAQTLTKTFKTPSMAVVGEVHPTVRQRAYKRVAEGKVVLVATRLADEGLDVPALDTLILAAPGRSPHRLKQQVGRIMRILQGKKPPVVYDICDPDVPTLGSQAEARRKAYEDMGLSVKRQSV